MDRFYRVGSRENSITGHQNISSGRYQTGAGLQVYTSVNLYQSFRTGHRYQFTQFTYLINGMLNKLLTAKSRIHTHHQHHIDIIYDIS